MGGDQGSSCKKLRCGIEWKEGTCFEWVSRVTLDARDIRCDCDSYHSDRGYEDTVCFMGFLKVAHLQAKMSFLTTLSTEALSHRVELITLYILLQRTTPSIKT